MARTKLLSSPSFHRAVRRVHGRLTGTKHLDEEVSNLDTGHSGTDLEGSQSSLHREQMSRGGQLYARHSDAHIDRITCRASTQQSGVILEDIL